MGAADWILLGVVLALACAALIHALRHRHGACSGDCGSCSACASCKQHKKTS